MLITFDLYELKQTFVDVARLAVAEYRKEQCPADDLISQREAYERFQEARVKRWRDEGLVTARRMSGAKNSKIQYSRTELMQVDAAERMRPIMNRKGRADNPSVIFSTKK